MFEPILRGWDIMKAGGAVLGRHPKLIILPIVSFFAAVGVIVAFVIPLTAPYGEYEAFFESVERSSPLVWAVLFGFYFASTFIIILFNAALVFCALEAFAGRKPSVLGGLGAALGRLPQILMWTLIATTVGLLLSALQSFLRDKMGVVGSAVGGAAEFAWTVMTYFVLPLVVDEGVSPAKAVERSGDILRKTWGEAVVGEGGLGIVHWVLMLPGLLLVGLSITIGQSMGVEWPTVLGVVLAVLYVLAVTFVVWALGVIFQAGVYVYATTGNSPGKMDTALLKAAFRKK